MTLRPLFLLLLSLAFGQSLKAQDTLSMYQTVTWNHSTAVFSQQISVDVTVENAGTLPYTQDMILYAQLVSNLNLDTVAMINHNLPATLNTSDTTVVSMTWLVDQLKYVGGGNNITVIWPANPNHDNYVKDSLVVSTFIDTTLGVSMVLPVKFKIFPNPSKGNIQLKFEERREIENVSFYTSTGRLVETYGRRSQYNLSHLSSGNYLVIVTDKHGRKSYGRFIIDP